MAKEASTGLTAYCMKTKKKKVPILKAEIHKTSRGTFFAKGVDAAGNKLSTMLSKEKALAAIKAGAKKAY